MRGDIPVTARNRVGAGCKPAATNVIAREPAARPRHEAATRKSITSAPSRARHAPAGAHYAGRSAFVRPLAQTPKTRAMRHDAYPGSPCKSRSQAHTHWASNITLSAIQLFSRPTEGGRQGPRYPCLSSVKMRLRVLASDRRSTVGEAHSGLPAVFIGNLSPNFSAFCARTAQISRVAMHKRRQAPDKQRLTCLQMKEGRGPQFLAGAVLSAYRRGIPPEFQLRLRCRPLAGKRRVIQWV